MTIDEVFLAALSFRDRAARAEYLKQACAGDDALLRSVESRLQEMDEHVAHGSRWPFESGDSQETPGLHGEATLQSPHEFVPPGVDEGDFSGPLHDADASPESYDVSFITPSSRDGSMGRLGRYEILHVVGGGAFGVVFKAFDESLDRAVAIKVLSPVLGVTARARKRFLREARAAAAIRHECVVHIHAVEENPLPYFVMEYVPGVTLQERIDRGGPMPPAEAVRIAIAIARGLAAAHERGLIHRDVKPANVLLEETTIEGEPERVLLTDFGLARTADDEGLTRSGVIVGTPLYMAPEQAHGEAVDHRADLFSLGTVLYAMLSGQAPFKAPSTMAVLKRVCEETPPRLDEINRYAPAWLCDVVVRLHEKNPNDRYQTAQELIADLTQGVAAKTSPKTYDGALPPASSESSAVSEGGDHARIQRLLIGAAIASVIAALVAILPLLFPGPPRPFDRPPPPPPRRVGALPETSPTESTSVATTQPSSAEPTSPALVVGPQAEATAPAPQVSLRAPGKLLVEVIAPEGAEITLDGFSIGRVAPGKQLEIARTDGPLLFVSYNGQSGWVSSSAVRTVGAPLRNSIGMTFYWAPPGRFLMGSPDGEHQRWDHEKSHLVDLTHGFWISQYETTQAEFEKVMGRNPSEFGLSRDAQQLPEPDRGRRPVENVAWGGAQEFAEKLSTLEQTPYRLPSEAEWEYACRAGTTTPFYFGEASNGTECNDDGNAPYGTEVVGPARRQTVVVGSFPPNPWGLHDMSGNVEEWCSDWYEIGDGLPVVNPLGPGLGQRKIHRGGSWMSEGFWSRSAARSGAEPDMPLNTQGFRVVVAPR